MYEVIGRMGKIEVAKCSICLGIVPDCYDCRNCNHKGLVKVNATRQICRGTNLLVSIDDLNDSYDEIRCKYNG